MPNGNGNRSYHMILDREIIAGVDLHARKLYGNGKPNISAAIRDLLRQALVIVADGYDAGWREGYAAAYAEAQTRVVTSFSDMSPVGSRK